LNLFSIEDFFVITGFVKVSIALKIYFAQIWYDQIAIVATQSLCKYKKNMFDFTQSRYVMFKILHSIGALNMKLMGH
jgi:hypothetical protein